MKQENRMKKLLIRIFMVIIVSFIGMGILKDNAFVQSADRKFFGMFSMVRYGLVDYPIQTASSFFKDVSSLWDVRYENDALRTQLEYANHWQTRVDELENEVNELKELNNLDSLYSDMELINANVKSRSPEKWDQTFTINIGLNHGVEVDDSVISPSGIVGRVVEVSADQAVVSSVISNSTSSQVAVKIQVSEGRYIQGILSAYDYDTNLFSVKLLDTTSSISEGMKVSTSGIGGIYPSGLFVGSIHSVKETADSLGTIVYVQSPVDFNTIKYVSVVKRK